VVANFESDWRLARLPTIQMCVQLTAVVPKLIFPYRMNIANGLGGQLDFSAVLTVLMLCAVDAKGDTKYVAAVFN
jgi:hypothetical protein